MVGKCSGTNVDGTPCSAQPRPGRPTCVWHDAATRGQRAEWSKRGGQARSNKARAAKALPAPILTTDELAAWLGIILRRTMVGETDPPVATACANLARTIHDLQKDAKLEGRIGELETLLGIGKRAS